MSTATMTDQSYFATSKRQAAAFFGIATGTLEDWFHRGCPSKTSDGYDLKAMLHWCKENVWRPRQHGESAGDSTNNGDGDESEAELRKQKLRLENRERELRVMRIEGQLVFKQAVLAAQMQQNANIRSRIEAIPETVATSISPQHRGEMIEQLRHAVRLILKQLASEGEIDD